MAPLTETGIEVVFTPEGVDDDIRREGVLCTIEVRDGVPEIGSIIPFVVFFSRVVFRARSYNVELGGASAYSHGQGP